MILQVIANSITIKYRMCVYGGLIDVFLLIIISVNHKLFTFGQRRRAMTQPSRCDIRLRDYASVPAHHMNHVVVKDMVV